MSNLKKVEILLPRDPGPLTEAFDIMVAREKALSREIDLVATLRDALLPKLLSGELRVKDAEPLVETAL